MQVNVTITFQNFDKFQLSKVTKILLNLKISIILKNFFDNFEIFENIRKFKNVEYIQIFKTKTFRQFWKF